MPDDQRASDASTKSSQRGVLLVGSVPLRPAARVFEVVSERLGGLVQRIPDGEQQGWLFPVWGHLANNDALELAKRVPLNPHTDVQISMYRLKPGRTATDLVLGPYGIAENALASYAQFRAHGHARRIPTPVPGQSWKRASPRCAAMWWSRCSSGACFWSATPRTSCRPRAPRE